MREGVTMSGFHASDRDQPRSGFAAHSSAWSRTRLIPVSPLDPRLVALAQTIAVTCNLSADGVQLAQFRIDPDPELADYFAHNRIEANFFVHFFAHADVRAVFPPMPTQRDLLGFCRETGPEMVVMLERAIMNGGAYRRFKGSAADARRLVADFGAAVGDRFATAGGWLSKEPWSSWFRDIAWDRSFFWFDRGTSLATVLITTDVP